MPQIFHLSAYANRGDPISICSSSSAFRQDLRQCTWLVGLCVSNGKNFKFPSPCSCFSPEKLFLMATRPFRTHLLTVQYGQVKKTPQNSSPHATCVHMLAVYL
uniref:Uncharacterized protein n=1 Tax=Sphaerodactylus townsendi TaxID=933632 RepID=A0ACB8FU15_9SAUR